MRAAAAITCAIILPACTTDLVVRKVTPETKDAFVAATGKPLRDKPARIEVARPPKRR